MAKQKWISSLFDKWESTTSHNPKNIMVERDFYKLSRITTSDLIFLETFIEQAGSEMLKQSHRNLVYALARIANANELIRKITELRLPKKKMLKHLQLRQKKIYRVR